MGFSSYCFSLSYYGGSFATLGFGLAALWLFIALWAASQGYRDNTSVAARVLWPLGMLLLVSVQAFLLVQRISLLRSNVRERFDIPGSIREDRTAAWQETARAIRQMRRHLLIDKTSWRETVDTLPAYVV
ncbi:hypothetical protein PHYBOEH_002586 [Phytophthora boehmeriae]|uniref:Uncharacterized protein n=1 Tax=Phytophthora boehmeriae TaxID=109152 RepID=A0A8T1V5T0_9STRA|nr:hypothetical protein PHYBOEH_002586 [Phytophthora boehmeriae]